MIRASCKCLTVVYFSRALGHTEALMADFD